MLTKEHTRALVQAGGAAPSGGNIQPWRVTAGATELEVWLDERRSTSFLDVSRYASVLALGSFAENVAIEARARGLSFSLDIRDQVALDAPMLIFRFASEAAPGAELAGERDDSLAPYIFERCTNRRPHQGPPASEDELQALERALGDDARLSAVGAGAGLAEVARILAENDALRLRHAELHKQMWEEVRFSRKEVEDTRDGVDVATLELPPGAAEQLKMMTDYQFVMDQMPVEALVASSMPGLLASSHLCCLSIDEPPTVGAVLAGGRALQRLWLTATQLQLAIQPWAVLPFLLIRTRHSDEGGFSAREIEVLSDLHARLVAAFGLSAGTMPLFTFRLARCGPPSARALRRDWLSYTTLSE